MSRVKRRSSIRAFFGAPPLAVGLFLLAACAGPGGSAPIDDRPQPPSQALRLHMVSTGETLYSIAFRYERDFRELARINGLDSSFRIATGQKLYLSEEAARLAGVTSGPAPIQQAQSVSATPPPTPSTAATAMVPAPIQQTPVGTPPARAPAIANTMPPMTGDQWVWPSNGRIAAAFGSGQPASKGLQIAGNTGEPVLAAGSGQVVYAGAGLRGYGNLLIVKHDEVHLSAYGHNRELLVSQGDLVHSGQQIAIIGTDPQGNHRLYFEIRRDGVPVDPIRYLPRR